LPQQILRRPYRTFDYAIRLHGKEAREALVPVRANSLVVDTRDFNIYAITESSRGIIIQQETDE
jgi:hypothetical protein